MEKCQIERIMIQTLGEAHLMSGLLLIGLEALPQEKILVWGLLKFIQGGVVHSG